MSAAGSIRGGYVEMMSVNEAEGRSQLCAAGPAKLAEDMARASLNSPLLEEGELPELELPELEDAWEAEKKTPWDAIDAQAEANARAQAQLDAEVDARMAAMRGMSNEQVQNYFDAQLAAFNDGQPHVKVPPREEKHQVNSLVAQAQAAFDYQFQTLPSSPGKRKAVVFDAPQNYNVRQVATVSKHQVEAEIRQLEILNGCDLSAKTVEAEQAKEKTLLNKTIPRLIVELQINMERKSEYASKHALWMQVANMRNLANVSSRIDPKLNAPMAGGLRTPRSPAEKAMAKFEKAKAEAMALGLPIH